MARTVADFQGADATGADVIFSTCSSIGEIADKARAFLQTPLVKIDEAMIREAVGQGSR